MIEKIAIVGSGEIAARVARTCERMGIATVTLFDPEGPAPHHALSPEQNAPVADLHALSDAAIEAVIAAAKSHGAQAVYPATPSCSASAPLAQAALQAELLFIGCAHEPLARMADRLALRELARLTGLTAVPSSEAALGEDTEAHASIAAEVGYPLVIKAVVPNRAGSYARFSALEPAELADAVAQCAKAAPHSALYVERWLDRPRVMIVPVLLDKRGEHVELPERESSLRRGEFALMDESPSPALRGLPQGEVKRKTMMHGAAQLVQEAGAHGLVHVEFLLSEDNRVFLHAMRPGLYGAVGATEMCTGRDLVEAEIRIALGEPLAENFRDRPIAGHAVEARVRSEATPHNPALGPKPDAIRALRWPPVVPGAMRIEPALAPGVIFAPEAEVLIANVVAYGQTRHQAFLILDRVLSETTIEPVVSNLRLLRDVLNDESFRAAQYDTGFIDRLLTQLRAPLVKEAS
jgi:acetyl-CoA carboxylase biotin carboxylase subunit